MNAWTSDVATSDVTAESAAVDAAESRKHGRRHRSD